MSEHNLIYVDIIEEPPLDFVDWSVRYGRDRDYRDRVDAHNAYLERYQAWRILIKSGDNQKALFKSTERYLEERRARHAVDLAFGPQAIVYVRRAEHGNELVRHPEPWPAA